MPKLDFEPWIDTIHGSEFRYPCRNDEVFVLAEASL